MLKNNLFSKYADEYTLYLSLSLSLYIYIYIYIYLYIYTETLVSVLFCRLFIRFPI